MKTIGVLIQKLSYAVEKKVIIEYFEHPGQVNPDKEYDINCRAHIETNLSENEACFIGYFYRDGPTSEIFVYNPFDDKWYRLPKGYAIIWIWSKGEHACTRHELIYCPWPWSCRKARVKYPMASPLPYKVGFIVGYFDFNTRKYYVTDSKEFDVYCVPGMEIPWWIWVLIGLSLVAITAVSVAYIVYKMR